MAVHVTAAQPSELAELGDVAARTFPLACPPAADPRDIAAFIAATLSVDHFAGYLDDPDRAVFVARDQGPILGYAMLIGGVPDNPDVRRAVPGRPAVELSKIYVLPESHGGVVSTALVDSAVTYAHAQGADWLWLGVNQQNQRAQRFYAKHHFTVAGTKSFTLGDAVEQDYVMVRALVGHPRSS